MVQSVARALRLLELLDMAGSEGWSLGPLAARAGLKPPTAHGLLSTLESLGYVRQSADTRRYALGPRARALGKGEELAGGLARASESVVADLHARVNETVIVALLEGARRRTVLVMQAERPLRVGADEGLDERLYDTATGRVLIARMDEERLAEWVGAHGPPGALWPEVRSESGLRRTLAEVVRQGHARYHNAAQGIVALATPILLSDSSANAALGLYLPESRSDARHDAELVRALRAAAEAIAKEFERSRPWPN